MVAVTIRNLVDAILRHGYELPPYRGKGKVARELVVTGDENHTGVLSFGGFGFRPSRRNDTTTFVSRPVSHGDLRCTGGECYQDTSDDSRSHAANDWQ